MRKNQRKLSLTEKSVVYVKAKYASLVLLNWSISERQFVFAADKPVVLNASFMYIVSENCISKPSAAHKQITPK